MFECYLQEYEKTVTESEDKVKLASQVHDLVRHKSICLQTPQLIGSDALRKQFESSLPHLYTYMYARDALGSEA